MIGLSAFKRLFYEPKVITLRDELSIRLQKGRELTECSIDTYKSLYQQYGLLQVYHGHYIDLIANIEGFLIDYQNSDSYHVRTAQRRQLVKTCYYFKINGLVIPYSDFIEKADILYRFITLYSKQNRKSDFINNGWNHHAQSLLHDIDIVLNLTRDEKNAR